MRVSVTIAILVFVLYLFQLRKNREVSNLHRLVAWVASKDNKIFRCNLSLLNYIHNIQNSLDIKDSRRVSGDTERNYAQIILDDFVLYLSDAFLCKKLVCDNFEKLCKYEKIDGYFIEIHFFMFQFHKYLRSHECDSIFLGYDMYKSAISYNKKGMWGGELFDATYEISDFAVVFHKLCYITFMFCMKSSIFSYEVSKFISEDSFAEVIDNRQIQITRR